MSISKREVILGLAAVFGAVPIGQHSLLASDKPPVRVDAHCHLHNGRDLPIFGLLLSAILEQNVFGMLAIPLGLLLAACIEDQAPKYDDENRILEHHLIPNPVAVAEYSRKSEKGYEVFVQGLKKFVEEYTSFGASPSTSVIDRNDELIIELFRRFSPSVISEKNKEQMSKLLHDDQVLKQFLKNIFEYKASKNEFGVVDELAQYYAQFFRWAATFVDYHFQLADDLTNLFGEKHALHIIAPAVVDFGPWPEAWWYRDALTSPYEQADLFQKISLIQPKGRMLVGYIGFDPWRQLQDYHDNVHPNSLDVVKFAVEKMGFVGVKLYPAMGFRPTNNSALDSDNSQFPPDLVELCKGKPGQELDRVLAELYQYCDNNKLAIQAHCADTIGSHAGYAKRAEPIFWSDVVKNYPGIRLNLGHFGGIWGFWSDPRCGVNTLTNWPNEIADMVRAGKNTNVYTDVADFSGVLNRWDSEKCATKDILLKLAPLLKSNQYLRSRLLYGSDWMMLNREPQNDRYYSSMRDTFAQFLNPTELNGFLGRNAVMLLGLQKGDPTRQRVIQFYVQNGKDPPDFDSYAM